MKKWMTLLFFLVVLVFLIGCQLQKETADEASEKAAASSEQPLSQEEADVADSIDDLDDLEEMDKELEEDINFDELENLE